MTTTVRGVDVHHLVRDPDPTALTSAPTHMLVSAKTGSATRLVHGRARVGARRRPRAGPHREARADGAGAAMAADQLPEAVGWQTIGRLAVLLGTPVARAVLRWSARPVLAKLAALRDSTRRPAAASISPEGDPRRLSAELIGVWADDLTAVRAHPERLVRSAMALASVAWAMFIDQRPTLALLDRLDVPVLLWGSDDPLADDVTLRGHARRPRWTPRVIEGAGHLLPVEVPDAYVAAVAAWLARA